jgi:ectoine hydroxylase-related dioxygenase (phytanoyl-CoA dioxygenase family)
MPPSERRALFEEQGYLSLEGLLGDNEVRECQEEVERLHHLAAELAERGDPAAGHFQREPFAAGAQRDDGTYVLRKIENTRQFSEVFQRLAAHPRLVAVLQELLGPDLLLFRSTLMLKPAHHGSAHGLHQDSAYWPMEPPALVTVSIALNDATAENGCIKVIPGSHRWGLQEWGRIARDANEPLTDRQDVDESEAVDVPLRAGGAVLFHSLTVHGSGPNLSPKPRNTALYAYFPPTVRYRAAGGSPRERTFPVVCGFGGAEEYTVTAAGAA